MNQTRTIIEEPEISLRLTKRHLETLHFPTIIKMPDQMYHKRSWWKFWQPKWSLRDMYSFYDPETRIAYLTEADYRIYSDALARRFNNGS